MSLNRQHAAELGQETVRILKTGFYMTAEGKTVEIGDLVRRAVKGTCSYPPNHPLPSSLNGVKETFFQVENETTLVAAYVCSFITCPAVNAKVALERNPSRRSEISIVMWERILRVLAIAAEKRHEAIILGAWGCGVFGNEPREISELFRKALLEQFRGIFAVVVFAVLDTSAGTEIIDPFRNVFSTGLDRKGNNR